jgi:NAD-dependent dihydropyrimidine dehydrogenase PreA subunit
MTAELNGKGYAAIRIDDARCNKCGVCYWVCPDSVFEAEG